jgi:aryl-alcohol dehydrogenase-like predicted oxidoreductase
MQYTTLGNTGLIVSRLSLGALTFSQTPQKLTSVYKVDGSLADTLVGRALDAGVNFFDTADVYANGESETVLGAALKTHRNKVVITTKVGNRGTGELTRAGLSRRYMMWSIDQSLKRLGTDWIDTYVAHCEDPFTPLEETLETFDAIVRAGKVRYIGFSNWTAWKVAAAMEMQKARGWAKFTHGQMYYSLLGRDIERDIVPMMDHFGLGLTVWSPLAYGFLSGAYTRETMTRADNRFSNFDWLKFDRDKAFAFLDVMRPIAARHNASMAQIALAWVLARRGVSSILLGATKLHQLEDNLGALNIALTAADIAELDTASAIAPIYATSQWVEPDAKLSRALRR